MSILQGIDNRGVSTGGIRYALICKIEDVDITFTPGTGATASTATFELAGGSPITPATSPFKKYAFTQDSSSGDAPQTGTPAQGSSVFAHTVNLTFNKKDAAIRNEVQLLADSETVIVLTDCNGYNELYGGQCDKGLYMTAGTAPSGVAGADLNGYVLTFTQASQSKLPFTVEDSELALIDPDNV